MTSPMSPWGSERGGARVIRGEELRARFRGCFLGAALGDAMGAPYEGVRYVPPEELVGPERDPGRLRYTDDTHMTIGVAESLIERGGFDGAHMASRLAENFAAEPWRGYGAGPPQVFRLLEQGVAWDRAGSMLFGGTGSFGNGAAMRMAPVALFAYPDLDEVADLARRAAVLTHTHELGVEGAVLQATAVAWVLGCSPDQPLRAEDLLQTLRPRTRSAQFREKLDRVGSLLAGGGPGEVVRELGHGTEAPDSVPTALLAFLRHPQSFAETVHFAISLGGDTDTIASMAGALAGAYLGEEAVPEAWRGRVEDDERLRRLADGLLVAGRLSRGRER